MPTPSPTAGALRLASVAAQRGERELFRGLSFDLQARQWGRVSGPNGSGKTTLLRIIAGLTRPSAGDIAIPPPRRDGGQRIAYLGHRDPLHGHLTPREHLRLAGAKGHIELLEAFGLAAVAELQCRLLSHGQKRRLALALLHIRQAPLWLLDEPATGLDTTGRTLLLELCGWHLAHDGMLLIATHEPLALDPDASLEIAFDI